MKYDLTTASSDIAYKILASTIVPRPIAWVTTQSCEGAVNAAPYSFFNVMGSDPPTIVLGLLRRPLGGFKDTAANILDTGEFVVNLVTESLAEAMNVTCVDAPTGVNELELAGLEAIASDMVAPPRIAASPVSFECQTLTSLVTGPNQTIAIGRVLCAHIADAYIIDHARGHIDTPALGLIARLHGGGWYARAAPAFQMERPTSVSALKT